MSDVDDKLKVEALHWLTGLRETAEKAQGFVLDQAPDSLKELVAVGRFENTAYMLLALALAVFGLTIVRKWTISLFDDGHEEFIPVGFVMLACLMGSMLIIGHNFHSFSTAWFGPRIYIVETLAELAGKAVGK